MRVAIIKPPESDLQDRFSREHTYEPLGIAYLAAFLREEGIEVQLIDSHIERLSSEQVDARLRKFGPDLIGFTVFTQCRFPSYELIQFVGQRWPKTPIVVGGPHPSTCAQDMLEHFPEIDYVVRSEGELALLDLCRVVEGKGDPGSVDSLSYRDGDRILHNPTKRVIHDLDVLPLPARDLLSMNLYRGNLRTDLNPHIKERALGIITSRGCPIGCYYCSSTRIEGRWRGHSPDRVLDEFKLLIDRYKVRDFFIWDDAFTLNIDRAREILTRMIDEQLNVRYAVHSRSKNLDQDLVYLLKESGCVELRVGCESGSSKILEQITRPRKQFVEEIFQVAVWCENAGLPTHLSFIVSHPEETDLEVQQTLDVMRRLKKYKMVNVQFNVMHIYPGTRIEEYARAKGILPKDFSWSKRHDDLEMMTAFNSEVPVYLEHFDMKDIYGYLAEWSKLNSERVWENVPQIIRNIRKPRDVVRLLEMTNAYARRLLSRA